MSRNHWGTSPAAAARGWLRLPPAVLALAVVVGAACPPAQAAGPESRHLVLQADRAIAGAMTEILSTTVRTLRPGWVYLQSDGSYSPTTAAFARVHITVDGRRVSNDSVIDWRGSTAPNRHPFNAIAAVRLPAGSARIALQAGSTDTVAIHAGTSLSVMTDAATRATSTRLDRATATLGFDTRQTPEGRALPAHGRQPVLSARAGNTRGPVVAMASGDSEIAGSPGDAMWGLFLNGREARLHSATWSINDLFTGAEVRAPMFVQGLFPSPPHDSLVQLVASESPYYQPRMASTNQVRYRIGAHTTLVTLSGGMRVAGRGLAPRHDYVTRGHLRRFAYTCIGTNGHRLPEKCPPTGTGVVLGRGRACVPAGHNGVVMVSAKSRIQGDDADGGGSVSLRIRIDGRDVATNTQTLGPRPHAVSTRTIGASYLATGDAALAPGCHVVEALGQAQGDFRNISLNVDLPVLWFD